MKVNVLTDSGYISGYPTLTHSIGQSGALQCEDDHGVTTTDPYSSDVITAVEADDASKSENSHPHTVAIHHP